MTDTAHRTDDAPVPPVQDDYSEDRHSGVRQLTPRSPTVASPTRLSMAWIASRLKWLLVVGLAWGFAFGFSLGHVLRAPREKIELSERTRIRTPATRPAPVAAAPVAAAPVPPSPAVTTTVAALAAAPIAPPVVAAPIAPPVVAAPIAPPVAAAPATAPRAIPEPAAAPRSDDATRRTAWRSAVLDAVERHDAHVRDCVRHAQSRGTVTPGRVRVTLVVAPDGAVRNVGWSDADPSQVRALGCITSAMRRWPMPAFEGDAVRSVHVPFDLP
ncbi:MAG: hypothetical protein U0326_07465 [Polyangiales bacterium]